VYGLNGLIGFIKGGQFNLVLSDRQGSSRVLVAQNATILGAYTYIPFGQFMDAAPGSGSSSLSYYYTAQEWDSDKGLYNYNARMYDPNLKRFYSTDAAGEGASPYAYCMNNPIMFTDPSGNSTLGLDAFGLIAGVALVGIGIAVAPLTGGTSLGWAIAGERARQASSTVSSVP
jgi:RHS repeat-associated protein